MAKGKSTNNLPASSKLKAPAAANKPAIKGAIKGAMVGAVKGAVKGDVKCVCSMKYRRGQSLALRGHTRLTVSGRHELKQRALGSLTRQDVRSMAFAAVQGDLAIIEPEVALLLVRTVALDTVLLEDWLYL